MPKPDGGVTTWREEILQVGAPIPLQGVLTRPVAWPGTDTALLLLNSGLLHHVGGFCLSVDMARAAAERGFLAARYDASGIGDSAARDARGPQDRRAVAELHEVMDALARREGVSRFVVMGLCSGAFTAFEGARNDSRVVGVVQIAGFAIRTQGWYLRHYSSRALAYDAWRRFVSRRLVDDTPKRRGLDPRFLESYDAGWTEPAPESLEAGYRALIGRDVHLFNIMTGGEAGSYLYEGQFRDMFPAIDFGRLLTEWHFVEATHTIGSPTHRRRLIERTLSWLDRFRHESEAAP